MNARRHTESDLQCKTVLPAVEAIDACPTDALPAVLAHLAALQARAAARLMAARLAEPELPTDELLSVKEAAKRLGVSADWLYRRADALPFARRLSPRALRFSSRGITRWMRQTR